MPPPNTPESRTGSSDVRATRKKGTDPAQRMVNPPLALGVKPRVYSTTVRGRMPIDDPKLARLGGILPKTETNNIDDPKIARHGGVLPKYETDDIDDPKIARHGGVLPKYETGDINDPKIARHGGILPKIETNVINFKPTDYERGLLAPKPATPRRAFKQRRGIGWDPQPEPPKILQRGSNDCWAAALASWSQAAKAKKMLTYDQIAKLFPKEIRDGMDIDPFMKIAQESFGMKTKWFKRSEMTREKVISLIKQYGPLFIAKYYIAGRDQIWWHDMVLYDVTPDPAGMYMVMNPAHERDPIDALTMDQILHGNNEVLVGFKEEEGAGKK